MNRYQGEILWRRFKELCGEEVALIHGGPGEQIDAGSFLQEWAGAMKNGKIQPPQSQQMSLAIDEDDEWTEDEFVPWSQVVPGLKCPIRWVSWAPRQRRFYLALQIPRDIYDLKLMNGELLDINDAAAQLQCHPDLLYRLANGKLKALTGKETILSSFVRNGFHLRALKEQMGTLRGIVEKYRDTFKR